MQVRAENLYYLLSYAWRRFEAADAASLAAAEVQAPQDLLARMLIDEVRNLLRQRLDSGYVDIREDLRAPRGKLLVSRSVARGLELRGVVECEFDDSTQNLPINRIIKATVRRLLALDELAGRNRRDLASIAQSLAHVSDVGLSQADLQRVQLHSNVRRYRLALSICGLLFRCLLPSQHPGRWEFRSFLGDERAMGLLFEDFVREFLTREQRDFPEVASTQIRWAVDGDVHGLFPGLRTDVTLRRPGHAVVIETKCYGTPLTTGPHGGPPALRSSDVCQLAAYLQNSREPGRRVSGALLYAVDHPSVPPTHVRLLGHDVVVRELNLDQPWQELRRALLEFASTLAGDPPPSPNAIEPRPA